MRGFNHEPLHFTSVLSSLHETSGPRLTPELNAPFVSQYPPSTMICRRSWDRGTRQQAPGAPGSGEGWTMKSPRGTSGRRRRMRSGCLFFCLGHCWLGDQQRPPISRWLSLCSSLLCVPGALPALHPQAFLLNSSHFLALCLCSDSTSLLYREHGFSKIVF